MDVEALMASNRFYHDNRHCKALNKIGAIENRRHRKAGGKATPKSRFDSPRSRQKPTQG